MHDIAAINKDDGTPGFGLYIHWPFCAAKCPYCDFNSHVRHAAIDQEAFVEAFFREMDFTHNLSGTRDITSVFIGGGTPSLMEPKTVGTILDHASKLWTMGDGIEITMEANPSSVEAERFKGYRACGVNRVSMGVQALNDQDLKFLGRLHDVMDARRAIKLAREIFPRMSFDLIYARPDQTEDAWATELKEAIDLAADHLSLYQLTIEPGTAIWGLAERGKVLTADEETASRLYELTQDVTADHGLPNYEISNHARPGAESRHNLTYWRYGDYVGVGPGAHGRLTLKDGARLATATERHPETWLRAIRDKGHGLIEQEQLTDEECSDEMLLMGLRLREGLDVTRYEAMRGGPISVSRESALQHHGMIERLGNSRIRATQAGSLLLDSVVTELACED